jgi:hypothetical protein
MPMPVVMGSLVPRDLLDGLALFPAVIDPFFYFFAAIIN